MAKRVRLTTAQALLRFLENQYLSLDGQKWPFFKALFAIFGHGNVLGLGEAITDQGTKIPFFQGHNEQGMAHAAVALAKQTRTQQCAIVTSSIGPGALNMVTAAGVATSNRLPLLLLPGDVFVSRQPDPVLQQLCAQHAYSVNANNAFEAVSRYWDRLNTPSQLYSAALNAMRFLTDPALRGTVTLCLPQDVQTQAYDYELDFFQEQVHTVKRTPLSDEEIAVFKAKLQTSQKPLIIAGGGVLYSGAQEYLWNFAQKNRIPLTSTQAGKGVFTRKDPDPLYLGGIGVTGTLAANRAAKEADLILAFGTKLGDFTTASKSLFPQASVVSINVCPFDGARMNAAVLVADCKKALEQLDKTVSFSGSAIDFLRHQKTWDKELQRIRTQKPLDALGILQSQAVASLSDYLLENDVVIAAAGSLPGDLQRLFNSKASDAYHVEYGFSCMGYEISGAVGAKIAAPHKEVFAFCGDGSFLMLHSELVTAVQEGIKINVLLFDNKGYQCIDNLQTSKGCRSFGNEFIERLSDNRKDTEHPYLNLDFVSIAQGYGLQTKSVESIDSLKKAIDWARTCSESTFIYLPVETKSMTAGYEAWWRTGVPQVSSSSSVRKVFKQEQKQINRVKDY